jgi:DNA-binding CsgD family transcriptional regulator
VPPRINLFERAQERRRLIDLLDAAMAGRGGVRVVEGAAGMGKTALLDLAAHLAANRGLRVLRARCSEIESDTPLVTLRALFERAITALDPAHRAAMLRGSGRQFSYVLGLGEDGPIAGAQLHRATRQLVGELAQRRPLALLVDDLHNADASSLTTLAALGRHLEDLRVALIVTRRPDDCGHDPAALEELALVAGPPLSLSPLSLSGVGAVLRDRATAPVGDELVGRGHAATGGNPFLVVELARAFAETEQPIDCMQLADLMAGVAQSLSAVLRVRVGRLGPDCAVLARAVSVLGDHVSVTEASAVAGLTREAALVAAAALAADGIFAADRVNGFAHPLVRAAVEADLLAAERTLIEERAVAVLLEIGADPARTAVHLLRTEPGGDPRAVVALRAAAAGATGAARPARAVVLLRRALEEQPDSPACYELLGELVTAELGAGQYAGAADHLRARLARPSPPAERTADVKRLARAALQLDGLQAAGAILDHELLALRGEPALVLEAERLWVSVLEGDSTERVHIALERCGDLPHDAREEHAMLAALAIGLGTGVESADVIGPLAEHALGDGALLALEGPGSPLHALAVYALLTTDRALQVEAEMGRALAVAREQDLSAGIAMASTLRGMARLQLGLLRAAEQDGLVATRAAGPAGGRVQAFTLASAIGVVVDARAELGDDAGARALLAEHGFGDLEAEPPWPALLPRARMHLAAGRAADALADAERASAMGELHAQSACDAAAVISLARTKLGDRSAALAVAREQLDRARTWRTPSVVARALRTLGMAHGDAAGVALLEEALELLEQSPAALERAHCLVTAGMLWRRTGQRSRALETLRAGADLAQRHGASVVAHRAREGLHVLGARPRRLAFSGADALTASERRAALLAAAGHTNREIAQELYLSIKTVESHLGRGFRKLGINSRTELGSALAPPPR